MIASSSFRRRYTGRDSAHMRRGYGGRVRGGSVTCGKVNNATAFRDVRSLLARWEGRAQEGRLVLWRGSMRNWRGRTTLEHVAVMGTRMRWRSLAVSRQRGAGARRWAVGGCTCR